MLGLSRKHGKLEKRRDGIHKDLLLLLNSDR